MNREQLRPIAILILLTCLALPGTLLAAVQAQLDRHLVYEGDTLTLTVQTDNPQAGEPDLTPLSRDFRILGKNASSQVTIINGKRTDKLSWRIGLEPLRLGKLDIPALTVGNEQTRPLQVTVSEVPAEIKAQQAQQLFIEATIDEREKNYVQQQISFRVRLYHDGSLIGGELGEPMLENAVVERLGEEARYTTTRNGRRYQVIERRYVISPERSGELTIPPIGFQGQVAAPGAAPGGSPLDNFFRNSPFGNDPFFRNTPFRSPGKPVRARSKPLTLEILPRPAGATGNWLPADKVTLRDSWTSNPPQLRAGEPVTRTITIEAVGLTGSQLPALEAGEPDRTRVYPDQPAIESRTDGNKVFGFSRQTFTYIPNRSGKLVAPPVELDWWNTETDKPETAKLPRWELTVAPGAAGAEAAPEQQPSAPASDDTTEAPEEQSTGNSPTESGEFGLGNRWWWLLLLLLIPLAWWLMRRRQPTAEQPDAPASKPGPQSEKPKPADFGAALGKLQQACESNNADAAASAILETAAARWPDRPPRNLGTVAALLGEDAGREILQLDRVLYAADRQQWNGSTLWKVLQNAWGAGSAREKKGQELLEPLYPER